MKKYRQLKNDSYEVASAVNIIARGLNRAHDIIIKARGKMQTNSNIFFFAEVKGVNKLICALRVRTHYVAVFANVRGKRVYVKRDDKFEENLICAAEKFCRRFFVVRASKRIVKTVVSLALSPNALEKIKAHVYRKPNLECGGYLIGSIKFTKNGAQAVVDDVFHDDTVGSAADYEFTSMYGIKAYSYCFKNYGDGKRIIGNYHSHASFNAFFSGTDRTMIFSDNTPQFYLVFSPSQRQVTGLYKDADKRLFAVAPDRSDIFKYVVPSIPFEHIE